MIYHAVWIPNDVVCVVRTADHGVNDIEFQHGCRILTNSGDQPLYKFKEYLIDYMDLCIFDERDWSDYIGSLDDPSNVPSNRFVSTRTVFDKWDTNRPIY